MKHIYTFLCLFLFGSVLYAGDYFNANEQGVAIDGLDTVAYFELKKAARGSDAHHTSWQGATWYFSNEDHKKMFLTDPKRFAPKYGGWCAICLLYTSPSPRD